MYHLWDKDLIVQFKLLTNYLRVKLILIWFVIRDLNLLYIFSLGGNIVTIQLTLILIVKVTIILLGFTLTLDIIINNMKYLGKDIINISNTGSTCTDIMGSIVQLR